MDLKLVPGARINMDALARQLSVSITPIREALSRLESLGLVEKLPMRGFTATPLLTAQQFEDLYEVRILLEPVAARHAAERIGPAQSQGLLLELESSPSADALNNYDGYRAFMAHDARFHELIHVAGGNQMITDALRRLHSHLHLFRLGYERRSGAAAAAEHRAIYSATASGRGEEASYLMTRHLESARDRLRCTFPPNE